MLDLRHALAAATGLALLTVSAATAQDAFPVSVPTMFGEVTIEAAPERVVALGWADAEILLALGVSPVGIFDWNRNGEPGVGPWAAPLLTEAPVVFSRENELNYEAVLALHPDLITNVRSDNSADGFARLSAIAPTVYSLDGEAFATRWDDQVRQLAAAIGQSEAGDALVAETEAAIAQVAADHPEFEGRTIQVIAKWGEAYGTYLTGDARFDLLTEFGFVGRPDIMEAAAGAPYLDISLENFEMIDSDVVILFALGYSFEELRNDPILAQVDAVRDGRAIFIDSPSETYRALATGSTLSIARTIEELVPLLAEAVAKLD